MGKKLCCLLLVICMTLSVFVPIASAADAITVAVKGETKFSVGSYSASYCEGKDGVPTYSNYASFNKDNWLEYQIVTPTDANYQITVYGCIGNGVGGAGGTLAVLIDGKELGGGEITSGTSWSDWSVGYDLGTYPMTKGSHVLRILNTSIGMHINSFSLRTIAAASSDNDFSKQSGPYKNAYIPTAINAENFDIGAGGSKSADGKNNGGKYRQNEQIDIFENAGNYYISLNSGEFVKYTFNVVASDVYAFSLKASGAATLGAYFDNMPYPVNVNVNSPSLTAKKAASIYLEEGEHSVVLSDASGTVSVDEIIFTSEKASESYITTESLKSEQPAALVEAKAEGESSAIFDFDSLDKPNEVYKNIYVSASGSDDSDGSKASPFKTVGRAFDEVAVLTDGMTGDIVVNIEPGYYELTERLKLTNAHGGKNGFNVIFKGTDIHKETVISGGTQVTGWEKASDVIWKAPLDAVDEVRNLYINDYPAVRARSKYRYVYREEYVAENSANKRDGIIVDAKNFPDFSKPGDLEAVWESSWRHHRYPVDDIIYGNSGENIIMMHQPIWSYFGSGSNYNPKPGDAFYFENAKELLDEPGEFYFDKDEKMIYYYPYKAENMLTSETYVGKTEQMLDIRGEGSENKITNLIIDNISFKYGKWDYVSENGIHNYQADAVSNHENGGGDSDPNSRWKYSPGQIEINYAENLTIKNCKFVCLGSAALDFTEGAKNVKVEGNLIRDISGTGIMIGTWNHATANGLLEKSGGEICDNFMVRNNVIRRAANEYASQTAISVYFEANISIVHNDISHVPYTGITAGWGWETSSLRSSLHKNINITHNKITDVLEVMNDGAQIYTLGDMNGSTIAYNYLTDSDNPEWGGIYLDAGSSNITIHDNVLMNNPRWFFIQSGYGAENDTVYNNFADTEKWANSGALVNSTVEEAHIISKDNIPIEAQKIIDEAGVERKYLYLLDDAELPSWKKERSTSRPAIAFTSSFDEAKYGWIQAEDFMTGGNGAGYYKITDLPNNNPYRPDGVALHNEGFAVGESDGWVIQTVFTGEWTKYNALIPKDGEYEFRVKYAHNYSSPPSFNLYIDDELVLEKCKLPKGEEAGWKEIVDYSCGKLNLSAGEHTVKFEYADDGFYLDALGFFGEGIEIGETDVTENSPGYDEGVIVYETGSFNDIAGHWAETDILEMKEKGVINGISETEFAPDSPLTKHQAIWLSLRAAGVAHTDENWEDAAISLGMISENGLADSSVSREEYAHIVYSALKAKGYEESNAADLPYSDKDAISEAFSHDVAVLYAESLMQGDLGGTFRPKDGLTRAEAATVTKRLFQK